MSLEPKAVKIKLKKHFYLWKRNLWAKVGQNTIVQKLGRIEKNVWKFRFFYSILIYLKVNKHYRHNYEIILIRINNLPSSEIILIYDINACIFLHVTLSQFGC